MNIAKFIVLLFTLSGVLISGPESLLMAQDGNRTQLRAGNRSFDKGDFESAEKHYRKALGNDGTSVHGHHNLGSALYKQQRFDEAYDHFRMALKEDSDSLTMNRLYYNFGNAALQNYIGRQVKPEEDHSSLLKQSIEAYSRALQYDPDDEDARHNLSKALLLRRMSEQQQQNPEQQEQREQDEKKQEQPMPETNLSEEDSERSLPEHEEGKISKEDAERMLNAIREKEMKTAEKIHERERQRVSAGKLKDW